MSGKRTKDADVAERTNASPSEEAARVAAEAAKPAPGLYYARRPVLYAGDDLDRGQIFKLKVARNDEKLVRLGYFAEFKPDIHGRHICRYCQREFIELSMLNAHGDDRHTEKPELTPREEDEREDARERMLEREAPLNLDRTSASQGG